MGDKFDLNYCTSSDINRLINHDYRVKTLTSTYDDKTYNSIFYISKAEHDDEDQLINTTGGIVNLETLSHEKKFHAEFNSNYSPSNSIKNLTPNYIEMMEVLAEPIDST